MSKNTIAFTIVSFNYLSLARILGNSFTKYHPDIEFVILIVDKIKEGVDLSKEKFTIVSVDDLEIKNRKQFLFKYNITELNTAVKPIFIRQYLMEKRRADKIIYIDPDIYVYSRMVKVLNALDNNDFVLTPHILSPIGDDGNRPSEIQIMQVGTYNLGFVAMRNTEETRKFVDWWSDRLYKYSISAPEKGLFTDQKWMDYVPSFINKVAILRDYGHNVAYWNLHERKNFTKKNEKYYINDVPLVFFHYSGFLIDKQNQISKFQDRFTLDQFNAVLAELFDKYGKELIAHDFFHTSKIPYAFGVFDNGVKIPDIARKVYYNIRNKDKFGNPFSIKEENNFFKWLSSPVKKGSQITNLIYKVYKLRDDIQKNIPSPFRDESAVINWALSSFPVDYGMDEIFFEYYKNSGQSKKSKIWTAAYNFLTNIERKYFIDSFALFRFVKRLLKGRVFNYIKSRFYKYKKRLIRRPGTNNEGIPQELFSKLHEKFKKKEYENSIILFRPHGIGDLLMALPAFKKLREKYPNKKIILYVYEESYSPMSLFPFFDEVIALPRTFNYEKYIDLIPRPKISKFYDLVVELDRKPTGNNLNNANNHLNRNILTSRTLGLNEGYEKIEIPLDVIAAKRVDMLKKKFSIDIKKLVIVTFESSNEARSWLPAYYKNFLNSVLEKGYQVVIVGNKDENKELFPKSDKCINLIGKTENINDVIELTKQSKFVISVDTYLCHLAGMMEIPMLAIFTGGIDPNSRLSYYKKKVVAHSNRRCYCWDMPCKYEKLRNKNEPCRIELSPDIALDKFSKLVNEEYE